MALSDELKGVYDQLEAMMFAAEALQKCLADPMCYKPYHGSDARGKILEMQVSINNAIKGLQKSAEDYYNSQAVLSNASKPELEQTEQDK